MIEEKYLIYFPDPFGLGASKFALANTTNLNFIDADKLADIPDYVLTYDVSTLIDDLRRLKVRPPSRIVDIGEAIRLATGLSKSDGGERKWDFWRSIKRHFSSDRDWGIIQALHNSRGDRPPEDEQHRLFGALTNAMISLWTTTEEELHKKDEHKRFFQIEVPAAQIFYARQYLGISINLSEITGALNRRQMLNTLHTGRSQTN